ncbi:hypothetical protein [Micromonospora carbonacea]|uniref:Uncharacterized protein n=1 Tax=Micromonospora carbonacea TaxID=47853 RepID=A0A1C5A2Q9_9ACTN|nr:hypothetical protein [Micromonospora carbonacea]SCF39502.1 hypothetical protein GA0070563_11129 [Micromonospora carbonacea]
MALLTATSVTGAATNVGSAAMSTSDTVSASDIGVNGALLQVINGGGSPINVTLTDPGTTRVGNAGTAVAQAVPAGSDRWFRLSPGHVNPSTGVATVTLSSATSVTYKLIRC